ncbi:hypothetical protein [Reinekea sp. G2M2-21]|uniref:DUF7931 domain-containing protein n=1 Tax=Reinekea sp. G2M2-21 TaxID=2788942 RepID=UPI0018AA0E5F|nr:hypothetical protein [Reinekea sp. G2M2-21]
MTEPNSDTGVVRLETVEDFVQYSTELINPALRTINILTTDMERPWLGHEDLVNSLKKAIVRNRRVSVRLLVTDPTLAIRTGHPLIPLIRKLSRFEARVIQQEMQEKQPIKQTMILVDRGGIVVRQSLQDFVGFCHFDDKHSVKNFNEDFDQYWRYSDTHADLRHLHI